MIKKSIKELIILGQRGEQDAIQCLLTKFSPLIKKYAYLLHNYEYEDAIQEMTITLYLAIMKIKNISSDAECLVYIKKAIVNRYLYLKKRNLEQTNMELFNFNLDLEYYVSGKNPYPDSIFKIDMINNVVFKNELHKSIIFCIAFLQLSDSEIAKTLNISRQYVNREKKKILNNLHYI